MIDQDALDENYYDLLGVPPGTEDQAITEAYWRLANPFGDRTRLDPRAGDALEKLNRAYSVLGSPSLRLEYDREHGFRGPRVVPLTRLPDRDIALARRLPERRVTSPTQANDFRLADWFPTPPGLTWTFLWLPVSWTLLMGVVWGIVAALLYAQGHLSPGTLFSSGQVFTGLAGIGAVVVALAGIAKQLEVSRADPGLGRDLSPRPEMPSAAIRNDAKAEAHAGQPLPDADPGDAEVQYLAVQDVAVQVAVQDVAVQDPDIEGRPVPADPVDTDSAIADDQPPPPERPTANPAPTSTELFHAYCEAEDDLRRESEKFVVQHDPDQPTRSPEAVCDAGAAAHLRDLKRHADECWDAFAASCRATASDMDRPRGRAAVNLRDRMR